MKIKEGKIDNANELNNVALLKQIIKITRYITIKVIFTIKYTIR